MAFCTSQVVFWRESEDHFRDDAQHQLRAQTAARSTRALFDKHPTWELGVVVFATYVQTSKITIRDSIRVSQLSSRSWTRYMTCKSHELAVIVAVKKIVK